MDRVYECLQQLAEENNLSVERKYVPNLRYTPMATPDIQNLKEKGHLIASHTHTHRKLSMLSARELDKEMKLSQSFLMHIFGGCDTLVYPYGTTKEVDEKVGASAGDWGYEFAYMNSTSFIAPENLFQSRLNMRNVSTNSDFLGLLAGLNKIF